MGSMFKSLLVGGLLAMTTIAQSKIPDLDTYIHTHCKAKCVQGDDLMSAIYAASDKYQVDPRAVLAIIKVESAFKPAAKNKGNVGLTQVLLKYHRKKFRTPDVHDVGENVRVGTKILKACLDKHRQDYSRGFACYNGGGTKGYAAKVMSVYRQVSRIDVPTREYLTAKNAPPQDHLGAFIAFLHPS